VRSPHLEPECDDCGRPTDGVLTVARHPRARTGLFRQVLSRRPRAWDLLQLLGMLAPTLPESLTYRIEQTPNGWLLVIENPHCSLSQLFHSSDSARQSVGRSAFALETLTAQHLERRKTHKDQGRTS
jgi:hypothetical protein